MNALTSVESLLTIGLSAVALLVALWIGARGSFARPSAEAAKPRVGELAWSLVALAVLVGVAAVAAMGGSHGS